MILPLHSGGVSLNSLGPGGILAPPLEADDFFVCFLLSASVGQITLGATEFAAYGFC